MLSGRELNVIISEYFRNRFITADNFSFIIILKKMAQNSKQSKLAEKVISIDLYRCGFHLKHCFQKCQTPTAKLNVHVLLKN